MGIVNVILPKLICVILFLCFLCFLKISVRSVYYCLYYYMSGVIINTCIIQLQYRFTVLGLYTQLPKFNAKYVGLSVRFSVRGFDDMYHTYSIFEQGGRQSKQSRTLLRYSITYHCDKIYHLEMQIKRIDIYVANST